MRLSAVTRLVTATMLVFLSLLLAIVGAFLVPTTLPGGVSVGVLVAIAGNYVIAAQARRAGASTPVTAAPALVWLVVVVTLASGRREGDVVLTGSGASLAFIVLGAVAAAFGIAQRPRPPDQPAAPREDAPATPAPD